MFRTRERILLVRKFFARPILPFVLQSLALAPVIVAPQPLKTATLYVIGGPVLLVILTLLNLPLVAAAIKSFRLGLPVRRNHALEHATILKLTVPGRRRLSGRARPNGFFVIGSVTSEEIARAFTEVARQVRSGSFPEYVSPRCGSNIVTALAFGNGLLLLVGVASLTFTISTPWRVAGLGLAVAAFVGMRHAIGNAIQRRFFMSVDFTDVSARTVRRVPTPVGWSGTTHFVETTVRVAGQVRTALEHVPSESRRATVSRRG